MKKFSWEAALEQLGGERSIHYSLENLKSALHEMGNPEKTVESLVIGGTNGKGGTTLFITEALAAHGYSIATYLSPHLQHLRERFLDGGRAWSESRLSDWIEKAYPAARKWKLSYFELLTLVFFLDSQVTKPHFNVLEVGLGGRLDATNVTNPRGVRLTNISWDHMDYLGDSLEKILKEKMGVLRPEIPVVSGVKEQDLQKILKKECQRLSCSLTFTNDIPRALKSKSWSGQEITIDGYDFKIRNPSTGALENAVTAYAFLKKCFPEVSVASIQTGFEKVIQAGRLEVVQENPRVILSGDHNVGGMESLIKTLRELKEKNLFVVCGFSPDKDAKQMIELLHPFCKEILLTKVPRARGEYPATYSKLARFIEGPKNAVEKMMAQMTDQDTLLITGSLYLVGELRPLWVKRIPFDIT